ncbi:hypothetical protein EMIT0373P_20916 [Pseudomonas chlororaphis]
MSIPSLFLTQHGLRSAEGAQRAATFHAEPEGYRRSIVGTLRRQVLGYTCAFCDARQAS